MMTLVPLILMFLMLAIGVPVGFCLILSVVPYFLLDATTIPASVIIQQMIANMESESMMAIPFFIAAGVVMNYSGITSQLMGLCDLLVGHMRGGLAQINVLLSTLMGGLCGSAAADCAMECKILVPEMVKRGYDKPFSAAVTAASSLITPMIPPGIGLLIYAFVCNVSVGKMFVAGYVPGIIMTALFMWYVDYKSKKNHYPPSRDKRAKMKEVLIASWHSIFALGLPILLIVGLRMGVFTATEGGAMCALYCVIVGLLISKEMHLRDFMPAIKETLLSTCTVMLVMCATQAFSYYLTWERIPQRLSQLLIDSDVNKFIFLLLVNIAFIILGMFIEGSSLVMIIAPLLLPAVTAFHIDLVHFGIIMVMNMTIGALSPPFGSILYLIGPLMEIDMVSLSKALLPYLLILVGMLFLFTYCPVLVTFVPNLVYG